MKYIDLIINNIIDITLFDNNHTYIFELAVHLVCNYDLVLYTGIDGEKIA
jgi:hypothetical protein